tara:strand:+ start:755 stop:991 length:237 start_codon:yes stop_codon:yes gene_type:complete
MNQIENLSCLQNMTAASALGAAGLGGMGAIGQAAGANSFKIESYDEHHLRKLKERHELELAEFDKELKEIDTLEGLID